MASQPLINAARIAVFFSFLVMIAIFMWYNQNFSKPKWTFSFTDNN